jgi:protein disulfide-isomerase A6
MKPAWDKLASEYESSSVVVGDADCTVEKDLCSTFGVKGYPTIKYFKDGDREGTSYDGGRDFDSLKKFVQESLEVLCDVKDPTQCDEKEKKYIADIDKQLARLTGMLSKPMKAELKGWVAKRVSILKQLSSGKEEL